MQKHCPKCRSLQIKKNCFNSDKKQKYKCQKCSFCFVRKQTKQPKVKNQKILFKYITEGYVSRQLGDQHGSSVRNIREFIQYQLDTCKIIQIDEIYDDVSCVIVDGTWIRSDVCMLVYYEYRIKKVLYVSFRDGERTECIEEDLRALRTLYGYQISFFIVDGGASITGAIRIVYPHALVQRCWVHIHRQVNNYLSKHPRSDAGKQLKRIVRYAVFQRPRFFFLLFYIWEHRWNRYLSQKVR